MGKEENTARRGRGRPRKQDLSAKPVCTAPVIELTSSSEDDEPAPKVALIRKPPVVVKPAPSKPPILGKRTLVQKKPIQVLPKPTISEKVRKLTDTEKLLSILEDDEDEVVGLPVAKEGRKSWESPQDKIERTKDLVLKSIEDELRYLDEVDETPSKSTQKSILNEIKTANKDGVPKVTSKRDGGDDVEGYRSSSKEAVIKSVTETPKLGSDIVIRRVGKPEKNASIGTPPPMKEELRRRFSEIKKIEEPRKERTKILSPLDVKLPPEVLEAIKKRSNLGRIEKIVEKTDANHKSKYIVIFNKSNSAPRKKSSIDEEIEALLKSLPSKPSPVKKPKFELQEVIPKVRQPPKISIPSRLPPILHNKPPFLHNKPPKTSIVQKPSVSISARLAERKLSLAPPSSPPATSVATPPAEKIEEPVRFTESPIGNEPPLPWDTLKSDGFDKYFTTIERLIEHHDSLDSDSDFDEPQTFSHFKNDGRTDVLTETRETLENDQISVSNITKTMTKEFPAWTIKPHPGTDTICLTRQAPERRGIPAATKEIKIDADYNVSVIVNNVAIPEYEGMYDSFDNIKQLVREIDQL